MLENKAHKDQSSNSTLNPQSLGQLNYDWTINTIMNNLNNEDNRSFVLLASADGMESQNARC